MEQLDTINSLAKSKRKSPVDTIIILGVVLVLGSSVPMYYLEELKVIFPIMMMALGIVMIIYGLITHNYLCKNAPEMLMPMETQVQTKILRMLLSDDLSQENKVDILKQLSGPPNANTPSLGA